LSYYRWLQEFVHNLKSGAYFNHPQKDGNQP
jgi:hypothetical protein